MAFFADVEIDHFALCSGVPRQNTVSILNVCINSGANASTSCKNLVNIGPVTSEIKKRNYGIFAATGPQLDDRSLLGALAFQNGLK